jgi:hypothetical protein
MTIEERDVAAVSQLLSQKFSTGDRWVAWENSAIPTSTHDLVTFKSNVEANKYCESQIDYLSENLRSWSFKPITNLLKSISGPSTQQIGINPQKVQEAISNHPVSAYSYNKSLPELLVDGQFHPVKIKQEMLPWVDISSFVVNEHHYPQGMIYEIGHTSKKIGEFDKYYDAQKCFERLIEKYNSIQYESPELKIIGKIKGQELALNFEDFPQSGTGILFRMANRGWEDPKVRKYEITQSNDLGKPIVIDQQKLAKYNRLTSTLEFFDGELKKVGVNDRIKFMHFGSLSVDPVQIVNANKQTLGVDQKDQAEQHKQRKRKFRHGL